MIRRMEAPAEVRIAAREPYPLSASPVRGAIARTVWTVSASAAGLSSR